MVVEAVVTIAVIKQEQLQSELDQLSEANMGKEAQISRLRKELMDVNNQIAAMPPVITEPVAEIIPEPEPKALTHGVEFSILGIASEVKSFVIVVVYTKIETTINKSFCIVFIS